MRPSLFPSDESLPTWLHTTLCLAVVSPFAGFLLWLGLVAIATGRLEPLPGPEIGQYLFGEVALTGKTARIAGATLLLLGTSFLALGLSFTRLAEERPILRAVPWALLFVSLVALASVR